MIDSKTLSSHPDEILLWRWQNRELDGEEADNVRQHLLSCTSCQRNAEAIVRLINTMQEVHHAAQPTLAEQMQLMRALEKQFVPAETRSVLVDASHRLVRWLAPAVAILVTLFVLLRQETATSSDAAVTLLPEMPESRLLFTANDEPLQQVMWELAVSQNDNKR